MLETMAPNNRVRLLATSIVVGATILGIALILSGRNQDTVTISPKDDTGASVVAISSLDPTQIPTEDCIKQTTCLRQWYQTLTWDIGPAAALLALELHGAASPALQAACHDTTHAVGEVAAYMSSIGEAMVFGDSSCGSGYYHGVVATTTIQVEPERISEVLISGCSSGLGFMRWECFHGVGHGFVFTAGGDIYRGVENCLIIEPDSDRGACGSGAFMQELADHGRDEKYKTDPYVICNKMNEPVIAGQCYDMLANLVYIHLDTPEKQFAECVKIAEAYTKDCYNGLGRARFGGLPFKGAELEDYCNRAEDGKGLTWCYEAAFTNTAAFYGNSDEAATHCPELSTDPLREMCRTWLTNNQLG